MARLDARVAAELPARAVARVGTRTVSTPVLLKDLSLGGALVQGLGKVSGPLTLKTVLPGGEVALTGAPIRRGRNGAAVRFSIPELPALNALWSYIRGRLPGTGGCPYCRRVSAEGETRCSDCDGNLEFGSPDYLEAHLRSTIAERVRSRSDALDLPRLRQILRLLDPPAPAPDADAATAFSPLVPLADKLSPVNGNTILSRVLDLLNAAALAPAPVAGSPTERLWWADHFLRSHLPVDRKNQVVFSEEAREWIRRGEWKGGFAALEEMVREGIGRTGGREVGLDDLLPQGASPFPEEGETYRDLMARSGKDAVLAALERNRFNIARSARELQISRPGLYWLMKRYDIRKPG